MLDLIVGRHFPGPSNSCIQEGGSTMITATQPTLTAVRERVDALVAHHPVVERNRYTAWFSGGRPLEARCGT